MKGVIHLRGEDIPVIDVRLKFGLEEVGYTEDTCIIVVDAGREVGLIVDAVSGVLDIPGWDIEKPPAGSPSTSSPFVFGTAHMGDAAMNLLDIDQVLTANELAQVVSAAIPAG